MMFIIKKTSFIVKKTSTVAFPVNFCLMTVALLLLSKYDFVSDIRRTNWKNGKIISSCTLIVTKCRLCPLSNLNRSFTKTALCSSSFTSFKHKDNS